MTYEDGRADQVAGVVSQAEWLASNGGGMVTGFALCVDFIDEDGDRGWATAHSDGQAPAHTLGLLRFHTIDAERQVRDYFHRNDED